MRIVFWGSERGNSITSNMLIVASYLACRKGYRIAMMELAEEQWGIENCFPKIGEYHMEEYIGTLIRRQLYYVSEKEWEKQEIILPKLIQYLELNMDLVFINLANRTDQMAKYLMWNADLVIVNLKQRNVDFDRYYAQYANLSSKIFLLIGNYYENELCNKESIQKKYRIPKEQLAVIPNNPEYQMACERGCLERYMRHMQPRFVSAIKEQFIKEVENTLEQIYFALQLERY